MISGASPEQQKIIMKASAALENNTVQFGKDTLKESIDGAKKKAEVYIPTAVEAALWTEGMSDLWGDIAKGNEEVAEALKKVRAMLNR